MLEATLHGLGLLFLCGLFFWIGFSRGEQKGYDDAATTHWRALHALRRIENWHELRDNDYDVPIEAIEKWARTGQGRDLE